MISRGSFLRLLAASVVLTGLATVRLLAQEKPAGKPGVPATQPAGGDLQPLELKLPKPAFKGTPTQVPPGTKLEPPRKGPRPPLMVPPGTREVAHGKPIAASDKEPIIGELKCVTDGDKEARPGSYVELGPGVQWVQIDLKDAAPVYGILLWHFHSSARVYHDVVVRLSNDSDFIKDVTTVYNNDHDSSAGLGVGTDLEYWDTFEGKLIPVNGVAARYVRLYSNGSTADDMNHYTEVEVFARPTK